MYDQWSQIGLLQICSILRSSYVIVQMGQSLESFMQWKSLVTLLLGCIDAVCDFEAHYVIVMFSTKIPSSF